MLLFYHKLANKQKALPMERNYRLRDNIVLVNRRHNTQFEIIYNYIYAGIVGGAANGSSTKTRTKYCRTLPRYSQWKWHAKLIGCFLLTVWQNNRWSIRHRPWFVPTREQYGWKTILSLSPLWIKWTLQVRGRKTIAYIWCICGSIVF